MPKLPMSPEELPFQVSPFLSEAINDYREALATGADELDVADALDRIESCARDQSEEEDAWVYDYYVRGSWRK